MREHILNYIAVIVHQLEAKGVEIVHSIWACVDLNAPKDGSSPVMLEPLFDMLDDVMQDQVL